jgi:ABC-type glycerol-3-phosphate transport system substrate-binding protein
VGSDATGLRNEPADIVRAVPNIAFAEYSMISGRDSFRSAAKPIVRTIAIMSAWAIWGCGSDRSSTTPSKTDAADSAASAQPTFSGITLKVASLEDPALAAVTADLVGEWRASRKAEVEVVEAIAPETGKPLTISPDVDVVLIRGDRLGELVDSNAVEPLGDIEADWSARPPVFDETISRYGPDRYAIPIGTSLLVLAYREEAVAAVKSEADKAGIAFPPGTWEEFDKFVELLSKKPGVALALPTVRGPDDDLPADLFLARATAVGKHRDYFSFLFGMDDGKPRIAGVPFVESLESIVRWLPQKASKLTPAQARTEFREGRATMLIDYAENAAKWSGKDQPGKIGVAPLPGSVRVYEPDRREFVKVSPANLSAYVPKGGGYLAAIAKGRKDRQFDAAKDFLKYLAGDSTAAQWASDTRMAMLPTRDAVLAQGFVDPRIAPGVAGGAWGEAVLKQIGSPNYVVGLRVPQTRGLLEDLETGVESAFQGKPAAEALADVSERWSKRFADYGLKRMTWHYGRSLVKPLTDAEPPPAGK